MREYCIVTPSQYSSRRIRRALEVLPQKDWRPHSQRSAVALRGRGPGQSGLLLLARAGLHCQRERRRSAHDGRAGLGQRAAGAHPGWAQHNMGPTHSGHGHNKCVVFTYPTPLWISQFFAARLNFRCWCHKARSRHASRDSLRAK